MTQSFFSCRRRRNCRPQPAPCEGCRLRAGHAAAAAGEVSHTHGPAAQADAAAAAAAAAAPPAPARVQRWQPSAAAAGACCGGAPSPQPHLLTRRPTARSLGLDDMGRLDGPLSVSRTMGQPVLTSPKPLDQSGLLSSTVRTVGDLGAIIALPSVRAE